MTLEAFSRELEVFVDRALSVEGRQAVFVSTARGALEDFEAGWRARQAGATFERVVDGSKVARLEDVRIPGGVVFERVVAIAPIVKRALELFDLMTKVVTGDYKSRTFVFADGARVAGAAQLDAGDDFVVIGNVSDFARKAERVGFNLAAGFGRDGLFETIASILQREFAETASAIYFTFRTLEGRRVPVIAIGGSAQFAGRRPRRSRTRR